MKTLKDIELAEHSQLSSDTLCSVDKCRELARECIDFREKEWAEWNKGQARLRDEWYKEPQDIDALNPYDIYQRKNNPKQILIDEFKHFFNLEEE